jgi:hypothetical protein
MARPEGPSCNSHDRQVLDTEPRAASGTKAQLGSEWFID